MYAVKKSLAVLLALVLCVGMLAIPTYAAEVSQDGLEVTLTTDKDVYDQGETIVATLTVTNTSDDDVVNVSLENLIPEGYAPAEGNETVMQVETLAAGETVTLMVSFVAEEPTEGVTEAPTEEATEKPTTGDKPSKGDSPDTGDDSALGLWVLLLVAAVIGLTVLAFKSKLWKQMLSLVLCMAMVASMFAGLPLRANATETEDKTIDVATTIQVGDEQVELKAKVTYQLEEHKTYTITFVSNGGSDVNAQIVEAGMVAAEPDAPTKDGFVFVGWHTDAEFTTVYDFTTPVNSDLVLYASWEPVNSEEESVPAEIAELYGVDPDEYDSDGDKLSNYVEIYLTITDPTKVDTDGNTIEDTFEDADEDGLTNIAEIEMGTDPSRSDSDGDGLSDWDEVNKYNTNPSEYDTDQDTICDGDEILLGLNPNAACSDGTTPDAQRTFVQELSEENYDESLLSEDNSAVPSLTLDAAGNVNRYVSVEASNDGSFSDSRAIVGMPVDVSSAKSIDGTLSFALQDYSVQYISLEDTDVSFPALMICKITDDGSVTYLGTEYEAGVLTAEIDCEGTYYVLDVKNLFDELGLSLPTVSDVSLLSDEKPVAFSAAASSENTIEGESNGPAPIKTMTDVADESDAVAAFSDTVKITRASSGAMAQADIVFIIDTTGSMGDEIDNVKNNIAYFVDALNAKGVSAALALIDYEDITVDGEDSTRVHKNGSSNWFYDVESYKTAISNLSLGYGGDDPECAVDALETARLLDMRASAGKIFVLVTDADYKVDNRYGIPSMAAEIELLKNAGVNCSVVSPSYEQSTYYDLYTETNGIWANIYGNFYEELMVLADKIGSDIVGDGCWIYLNGPVPVPVRLDAVPEEGSTVDTDGDGIPDIKELEGATPSGYIDLDALVTELSRGVITGTEYGLVQMYKYHSNPVEEDTDFDGIEDIKDSVPKNNTFEGVLSNSFDEGINVSFSMDYRKLIDDSNTQYSSNKSTFASVLATLAYGGSIEINSGASVNGSAKELYTALGLLDFVDYSMKDMPDVYKDDDISEILIGHRLVTYQGQSTEVFVVSVRGTNGTVEEWSSNFDVGSKDEVYWDYNNSEWKNPEHHKGFDVTANRCYQLIMNYINNGIATGKISATANKSIFITGHSRGAAITNLLGKIFEDDSNFKSSAYGFATPNTTTASGADSYETIFNVVNEDDLVPYLPLERWGFTKYGTEKSASIKEDFENKWFGAQEGTWEWLINANREDKLDYNYNGHKQATLDAFAKIAATIDTATSDEIRKSLYVMPDAEDCIMVLDKTYKTEADAEADIQNVKDSYGKRMSRASVISVLKTTEGFIDKKTVYKLQVAQTPEFLMMTVAALAGGDTPSDGDLAAEIVGFAVDKLGYKVAPLYSDARKQFIHSAIDVIGEDGTIAGGFIRFGGMTHGHWPETYYLLAKYMK